MWLRKIAQTAMAQEAVNAPQNALEESCNVFRTASMNAIRAKLKKAGFSADIQAISLNPNETLIAAEMIFSKNNQDFTITGIIHVTDGKYLPSQFYYTRSDVKEFKFGNGIENTSGHRETVHPIADPEQAIAPLQSWIVDNLDKFMTPSTNQPSQALDQAKP